MDAYALQQLTRAPAALSVPGDTFAGAAAAGWPFAAATPALAASACCLYWAGMALNDYADRRVDAAERPGRPIPSGRVTPLFALGLAGGLTAAGVGTAGLAGGRPALALAVPLAGTVWAYDLVLKNTPAGPAAMAAARTLDVLLGAGAGRLPAAVPAAATMGAHTLAVTTVSRSEVTGSGRVLPALSLAATGAVTVAVSGLAVQAGTGRPRALLRGAAAGGPLAAYTLTAGRAQFDAVRDPSPQRLQRAVGAGILGMIPLQAALTAATGMSRTRTGGGARRECGHDLGTAGLAAAIASAFPLARRLSRKVSPT